MNIDERAAGLSDKSTSEEILGLTKDVLDAAKTEIERLREEIERLREENRLLSDLFHEAVALPQGECPRPATAGDGMFNPQHKALGEKE
jgi:cell shape-determining protein MreC